MTHHSHHSHHSHKSHHLLKDRSTRWLVMCGLSLLPLGSAQAWEPSATELDAALKAGDVSGYFSNISTWLNARVPADPGRISEAALQALLKDPAFVNALDQRQLIAKLGVAETGAFAKAESANAEFLGGLLKSTPTMDLLLEAVGPTPLAARDDNSYRLAPGMLERWQKILQADPDAKAGIYQKLAIATALRPPGTGNRGAGGQNDHPAEPVGRYLHFKKAHQNKELFASFDNLTVWEYQHVVSSCASDGDLAWAREMINTWRPDLRHKEQVVNSTSEVWRRNSPIEFAGSFKNVLAGGGKCGPRSSWGVFICQAFGIPSIGVGQPAHACIAAKSAYPQIQPQPGSAWKVHQGRGWDVSRLDGTSGPVFLEAMAERAHAAEFSQIEHLRWLATTLTAKEAAAAVRTVANKIRESAPALPPVADPVPAATLAEAPIPVVAGTLHVEAETFTKSFAEPAFPAEQKGEVIVMDCFTGGKQVYFQRNMTTSKVDYAIDAPAAGTYEIVVRLAVVNVDQVLDVSVGDAKQATIKIPNSNGLWITTAPVEVNLAKGPQTLSLSAPMERGIAIRWFELKAK